MEILGHLKILWFLPYIDKHFRVIAVDLRGFGRSSYNNPIKNYIDDLAIDVGLFCQKLGLKNVNLLGWSLGGGVTMKVAANYPEIIDRIILHCSIGVDGLPWYFPDEKGLPDITKRVTTLELMKTHPFCNMIAAFNTESLENMFRDFVFSGSRESTKELLSKCAEVSKQQRHIYEAMFAVSKFNITNTNNGVADGTNEVTKIKCPTLILAGKKDLLCPFDKQEGTKAALGDLATLKVFDDSAHGAFYDHPDEIAQLLKDFIK